MTAEIDTKVTERLAELKPAESRLASYVELYRRLLELRVEDSYLPKLELNISEAAKRFGEGKYVLRFEDLLLDWEQFQKLFQEASSIVKEFSPNASGLGGFVSPGPLLEKAARAWYENYPPEDMEGETGVSWELLSLTIGGAFHPLLARYSEVLSPLVNQDSWRQRVCPVCGGRPNIAYLSKESGARWLVCSWCDTEWLFLRLECPFCSNQDQDSLAYFTDENELYRLYICEACRSYIKAIDLRRTEGDTLFPLERILTLDMDRQALQAGYKPGG